MPATQTITVACKLKEVAMMSYQRILITQHGGSEVLKLLEDEFPLVRKTYPVSNKAKIA